MKFVTLLAAILLAGSAAFFSVVGLTKIFVGVTIPFIILEFGKFVGALHLHNHWNDLTKSIRVYLTTAIAILMMMTSMGIFGYLANSAMVHTTASQKETTQIEYIETQIGHLSTRRNELILEKTQLNKIVDTFTNSKSEDVTLKGNSVFNRQKEQRKSIDGELKEVDKSINELNVELNGIKNQFRNVQVEIGPAMYMANAIYGDSSIASLEGAIRIVIYFIIFTFDPLAVVLLIVATDAMKKENPIQIPVKREPKVKKVVEQVKKPTIDDIQAPVETLENVGVVGSVDVIESNIVVDPFPEQVTDGINSKKTRLKATLERKEKQKRAIEKKIENLS